MIITISRQSATNGFFVAQLVAERLGLRIFDGELVDEIARRAQVDPSMLTHFDEMPMNPVSSLLWEWRSSLSPQVYARHVRESIRAVAKEGNAIIIGRGANIVLRGPDYLHVRIVAPFELRVAMYCAGEGVSEREAQKWIKEQDVLRADYIRKHYNKEIDDPVLYDLILNLDAISLEGATELIAQAACMRRTEKITKESALPVYMEQLAQRRAHGRPQIVKPAARK